MIEPNIPNQENFEGILTNIVEKIKTSHDKDDLAKIDEREFEKTFYQLFKEELKKNKFDLKGLIYEEGSTTFPDIQYPPFGIEIKTTKSDKWQSLGNSIREGTRNENVSRIYVAFLKRGGDPDIKIGKYESVIDDIKVTHSPRYHINMETSNEESIFKKLGLSYNEFQKSEISEKIKRLRDFYKREKRESWWLDTETGENVTSMGLVSYDQLSKKRKRKIISELYALFPEMLESDYGAASVYLVTKYGIYDKSFRDKFSAGGKKRIFYRGQEYELSRNIWNLFKQIRDIVFFINQNEEFMKEIWGIDADDNILELWFHRSENFLKKENDLSKPPFTVWEYYAWLIEKEREEEKVKLSRFGK